MGFWDKLFGTSAPAALTPQKPPEKPWYTTSLKVHIGSYSAPSAIFCKSGIVYGTYSTTTEIGYFSSTQDTTGHWRVYCDEARSYEIGRFFKKSTGDIIIYLSLTGEVNARPYMHSKIASSPHGFDWCVAEILDAGDAILSAKEYTPLGHFKGSSLEAAAAFIAWAFDSYGNEYHNFYEV